MKNSGKMRNEVRRMDLAIIIGIIGVILFAAYIYFIFRTSKDEYPKKNGSDKKV